MAMRRQGLVVLIGIFLFIVLSLESLRAQNFVSYFTGDTANVVTQTQPGTVLMGGSTENDSAMVWWLKRSGGGDVVVIRASGSDGYNSYLYSDLGETVNSVETILFNNRDASFDSYVIRRLQEADALWIAGGDQSKYVDYWRDSPVDSLINWLIMEKKIPIGGTSAGMAILGGCYFSATNGSVTTSEALSDPFNSYMTLGRNDFLQVPFLRKTVTDTHFDNPDRRGRLITFLARLHQDSLQSYYGIASEEKTAVCVDEFGIAKVFGNSPMTEFAYFVHANCEVDSSPEVCQSGVPLTWVRTNKALKAYRVPGTNQGSNWFNISDWKSGSGGIWQNWYVNAGSFGGQVSTKPNCLLSTENILQSVGSLVFPNPTNGEFFISVPFQDFAIFNSVGQKIDIQINENQPIRIKIPDIYFIRILEVSGKISQTRLVVSD